MGVENGKISEYKKLKIENKKQFQWQKLGIKEILLFKILRKLIMSTKWDMIFSDPV